ncbi:MAG: type II toxin-antitoxin system PemK/MazF family toxin [Flavonifractor plautii]
MSRGACVLLIVQNDTGNRHSPTVIAAAITSQTERPVCPPIELSATYGLPKESVVLLEQIRTLDKRRLREHMGRLDEAQMQRVDNAIAVSFGLHTDTMV